MLLSSSYQVQHFNGRWAVCGPGVTAGATSAKKAQDLADLLQTVFERGMEHARQEMRDALGISLS